MVFDRAWHRRGCRCPLLVLHGAEDESAGCRTGATLRPPLRTGIIEITGGHHNDLWTDPVLSCALHGSGQGLHPRAGIVAKPLIDLPDALRPRSIPHRKPGLLEARAARSPSAPSDQAQFRGLMLAMS